MKFYEAVRQAQKKIKEGVLPDEDIVDLINDWGFPQRDAQRIFDIAYDRDLDRRASEIAEWM